MANQNPKLPAAVAAAASPAVESKPEIKKIARATADMMLAANDITAEMYAKWDQQGRLTSGSGGGDPVAEQLVAAGVKKEDVDALYATAKRINDVLWKDAKTYQGKTVPHEFTYNDVAVEKPAQLEVAVWVKHFDPAAPKKAKAAK